MGIWKNYHLKNFRQIIGLDLSNDSVSACIFTQKPTETRQFYYDCDFHKFEATAFGIAGLLALIGGDTDNTIAIMEPTGVNYSRLWGTQLPRVGVEVRLVGHEELC